MLERAINVQDKVSDLQAKLFHAAKQSLERKSLKRKYNDSTRDAKRVLGNLPIRLGLREFGGLRYFNANGY